MPCRLSGTEGCPDFRSAGASGHEPTGRKTGRAGSSARDQIQAFSCRAARKGHCTCCTQRPLAALSEPVSVSGTLVLRFLFHVKQCMSRTQSEECSGVWICRVNVSRETTYSLYAVREGCTGARSVWTSGHAQDRQKRRREQARSCSETKKGRCAYAYSDLCQYFSELARVLRFSVSRADVSRETPGVLAQSSVC